MASRLSQVRARLGPGGYCRRPRFKGIQPCLPAAHRVAPSMAWYGPASTSTTQDPREGPSLARRMTPRPPRGSASLGWLPRSRDFYARCTSRGSADMNHDDQGQVGASGRRVLVSSLVQRRQIAGTESQGSSQRFPFSCNKTKTARTAGRRSSPRPPRRHDQRLLQAKTTFVRIRCTSCLPSNLAVVGSLPTFIWEEDKGHYK